MAKRVDDVRGIPGLDFKNRARRRREGERRSAEAEEVRARAPRRNDLRPRLRMVDIPLAELRGAKRRIHKNDEAHVVEIMASFEGFGVSSPILITADREIVNGHFMVEAAKRLGTIETMPCVIVDHLDSQEIRLLRLALNRIPRNAVFDMDAIQLEMRDLIELDTPIELSGFSGQEIDQILLDDEDIGEPEEQDLEADPRAPVVARPGDRWTLGRYAILAGSALGREDYVRLLQGTDVRIVLTDEPYNVKVQGHITRGDPPARRPSLRPPAQARAGPRLRKEGLFWRGQGWSP